MCAVYITCITAVLGRLETISTQYSYPYNVDIYSCTCILSTRASTRDTFFSLCFVFIVWPWLITSWSIRRGHHSLQTPPPKIRTEQNGPALGSKALCLLHLPREPNQTRCAQRSKVLSTAAVLYYNTNTGTYYTVTSIYDEIVWKKGIVLFYRTSYERPGAGRIGDNHACDDAAAVNCWAWDEAYLSLSHQPPGAVCRSREVQTTFTHTRWSRSQK